MLLKIDSPPRPNLKEIELSKAQLDTISRVIAHWLEWQESDRRRENLITDSGTHVMTVPVWPSRGQFVAWIEALIRAQTLIDSLLSELSEARNNALGEAAKVIEGRAALGISDPAEIQNIFREMAFNVRAMRGNAE